MLTRTASFIRSIRPYCIAGGLMASSIVLWSTSLFAQDSSGYYTDPATGVVYRKVQRTIERPVVETQMRTQESTVYRPETVVSTRPETRTVYTPVVSYDWEPRLTNRWNPFAQPTVVYQHTPRTRWETRSETIERQETRTNWVAETRKVDVPQQIVRIQREEKTDFEPVGKVATQQQATPPNSSEAAIASRLRPMDSNTQFVPLYGNSQLVAVIANNQSRNTYQSGMRPNELYPAPSSVYSAPLPPAGSNGVAGLPLPPVWR
jgi:hypothetical protein